MQFLRIVPSSTFGSFDAFDDVPVDAGAPARSTFLSALSACETRADQPAVSDGRRSSVQST